MSGSDFLYKASSDMHIEPVHLSCATLIKIVEPNLAAGSVIGGSMQTSDKIICAISGKAQIVSGTIREDIKAGMVYYVKKGVFNQIIASKNSDFRFLSIEYMPNTENELCDLCYREFGYADYFLMPDTADLKTILMLIIREYLLWDNFTVDTLERYMNQLFVTLFRMLHARSKLYQTQFYDNNPTSVTLYKVLNYIDKEFINIRTVEEISVKLKYNKNYLSHIFKEKVGRTIKEHLTRKKIDYAKELMSSSNMNLEEISEYLNFSSSHSFRCAFKKYTGKNPTQYIEANTSKKIN